MRANQARYPIACMCRVLGVSPSGYYAWRGRPPSRRARENEALSRRITAIHGPSRGRSTGRGGYTRSCGPRVWRLMRALGRQGVTRRRRRCTTRRDREAAVAPDRVQRRFEAAKPNQVWVADITYVPTQEGFLYLATVLDVFSRKVVGWAMSARQTVELVQSALEMALEQRAARGVVFHSDRGCQYTALAFSQRSMGRVGSCFDNAMAESHRIAATHPVREPPAGARRDLQIPGGLLQPAPAPFGARLSLPGRVRAGLERGAAAVALTITFRRALLAARFRRRRALLRHLFAGRLLGSRWSPSSPRFHCLPLDFSGPLHHHGAALSRATAPTARLSVHETVATSLRLRAAGSSATLGLGRHTAGTGAMRHDPPQVAQDRRVDPGQRTSRTPVVR